MSNFTSKRPTAEGEACPLCRTGPFYGKLISVETSKVLHHSYTCNCSECLVIVSEKDIKDLKTKWAEAIATASFMKTHDTF